MHMPPGIPRARDAVFYHLHGARIPTQVSPTPTLMPNSSRCLQACAKLEREMKMSREWALPPLSGKDR